MGNKSRCGRKEENTGDEKGFSTFLWCAFLFFGWCVFLGGRKLDEKENWEGGDKECVGNRGKKD